MYFPIITVIFIEQPIIKLLISCISWLPIFTDEVADEVLNLQQRIDQHHHIELVKD